MIADLLRSLKPDERIVFWNDIGDLKLIKFRITKGDLRLDVSVSAIVAMYGKIDILEKELERGLQAIREEFTHRSGEAEPHAPRT